MAEMTMPAERKHPQLYGAYQWWFEISELQKKHKQRIGAIERGVSNMDAEFERDMLSGLLARTRPNKNNPDKKVEESFLDYIEAELKYYAEQVPCYEWATSVKGLGNGKQVAKVLALIDDITKFATVSKFWRYCGYGVYQYWMDDKGKAIAPKDGYKMIDGRRKYVAPDPDDMRKRGYHLKWIADRKVSGWICPYHTMLKSSIYIVVQMFIQQRTEVYRDYYDQQKMEYRVKHPEVVKVGKYKKYTDGHINDMTIRKVAKLWLQHLYVVWYTELGLPVTKPWAFVHGGHTDIINPPHYDMSKVKYIE
jgi:hypothetical protein